MDAALRVRRRNIERGALIVDVVRAVLRVVFDGEDDGVLPIRRMRDGIDDAPKRVIVLRNIGLWYEHIRRRGARVVVWQADDLELREIIVRNVSGELALPFVDPVLVAVLEV